MARKKQTSREPILNVSAPPSMQRAGTGTALLLAVFAIALVYLAYVLVTRSPFYMAKAGKATYGIIYDRTGEDVLFDGSKPLSSYGAGHFSDIGNLIGDTSGQMSNTIVAKNIGALANYSFLNGNHAAATVSLQTTLSHKANRAVFQAMGSKNGAVIAYNWQTGEVLVCFSKPCVDIAKGYDDLASMPSGSLLCKAFYPTVPGSTQKVSTLIAAYERNGIESVNALTFSCEGAWTNLTNGVINCHQASGHGLQTLSEAFANSCNPYFAQLVQSKQLPLSAIIETYTRMGYAVNGETVKPMSMDGIQIPAASTTLEDNTEFETQWGCLGQGKTLVSPYQLMLWQGAIANGTGQAVKPYLLASKTDTEHHTTQLASKKMTGQFFSAEAAKAVQNVMTENATNHYYVSLGNFHCGVKSGTAQIRVNGEEYENSLLTGFCLDDTCPIAFCILIEERITTDISTAQIAKILLEQLTGIS